MGHKIIMKQSTRVVDIDMNINDVSFALYRIAGFFQYRAPHILPIPVPTRMRVAP